MYRSPLNQTGLSFLRFLMLVTFVAVAGVGGYWYLQRTLTLKQHSETLSDIARLEDSIQKTISCERTWVDNAINPEFDCLPGENPKAIVLKDANGKALTQSFAPHQPPFDPLASSLDGSGQSGPWYLRTYCDRQGKTLVIRVAKGPLKDGQFYTDPFDKTTYDWKATPPNPLFGVSGKILCKERFNASSEPTLVKPPAEKPIEKTVTDAKSSLERIYLTLSEINHEMPKSVKDCNSLAKSAEALYLTQTLCKRHCEEKGFFSGFFEECCSSPQCSPAKASCACVK